ncbi:T-cell immunoglobulin and mucin domain-containing protein 4-like isoform X1 [Simochromis diagramma]|uniref:Hepatitis A virus cellular receptor 2 homolog n=2 Tax=Haplochromis burtoni TaxID=8153 RepID=A0A3Q2VCS7_HAPBU|nr:T-cell immunoglobulin and mucin domain-containing protein 4 isoform X1 [Haplochromis burtoni]XP_024655644.1 T-cell immunoglobulin and mucin domain-containing protein 4 [Maylandia zebra]XP_039883012.1 T-cell immunoglobulin and mucin domain-containing protein 4-like isoform X1 [Simochromis diagramma]XP_039883013.1 T-cell immunoglobulin and mucin domain-containing protein 4-like isoform X1 [Simochromis diagramma]
MLPPLHAVCVLSALTCVSAVTMETVVGHVGTKVMLPCRTGAGKQGGVEVCWGRGKPSLFTCHNAVINSAAARITYRKSQRYSVSASSSSLSIFHSQPSDSGFYHCRVQVPGLFNDQTFTVHLIILSSPRSVAVTENTELSDGDLNAPHTTTGHIAQEAGSDITGDDTTQPVVALVQSAEQQVNVLQTFVGNTVRASSLVFIPALLLTAAYRVWRSKQEAKRRPDQSEKEEESSAV